jgi:serine/threonine protein kinase
MIGEESVASLTPMDITFTTAPSREEISGKEIPESTGGEPKRGGLRLNLLSHRGAFPDHVAGTKWIRGALIGEGSSGQVYLGMSTSSGLLMAVKRVDLLKDSAPDDERKKGALAALKHEIKLRQEFSHTNIVQFLGVFAHFGFAALVVALYLTIAF